VPSLRSWHQDPSAKGALAALPEGHIIPIVNVNDTVTVEGIMVGDNDNLAAITSALVEADLLVLLTDVNGVYERSPSQAPTAKPTPYAARSAWVRRSGSRPRSCTPTDPWVRAN
jgi:glutamate 5-kinase